MDFFKIYLWTKSYLTGIQEVNRSQRSDRLHEKIDLAPALGEEPFAHHLEFKFGAKMAEVGDEHLRELVDLRRHVRICTALQV